MTVCSGARSTGSHQPLSALTCFDPYPGKPIASGMAHFLRLCIAGDTQTFPRAVS